MRCPYCNSEIKDGAKFCTECGATLNAPAAQQQGERIEIPTKQLAEGGLIIAEHDAHADFPAPEGWRMARRKTYRDTALSFYEEDA